MNGLVLCAQFKPLLIRTINSHGFLQIRSANQKPTSGQMQLTGDEPIAAGASLIVSFFLGWFSFKSGQFIGSKTNSLFL